MLFAISAQSDLVKQDRPKKYEGLHLGKLNEHVKGLKDKISQKMGKLKPEEKQYRVEATHVKESADCDASSSSTHLIHFDDIQFSPETVQVPGNITVSAKVTLDQDLSAPITAAVEIKKRVLNWWVTIPCTSDQVGSCTYDDICQYLPNEGKEDSDPCPKEFTEVNLPCKCPVAKDVYQVKDFTAAIPKPDIDLPLSGQYQVTARITQQDTDIGCVQLAITVQELTKKTINDSKIQQKDRKVIYN